MADKQQLLTSEKQIAAYIGAAFKIIGLPFDTIPRLFEDKEICIMDYLREKKKDRAIEIRFDTATLTCLFSEDEKCDFSFLFLDDTADLKLYIKYCNESFPYDFVRSGWRIGDYYLRIKVVPDDCIFILG